MHAKRIYIYILYCYIACWKWIAINECMQLGSCCGANAARLCITCRMFGSWQGQHIMIDVYKIISKNMHAWKICKIVLSKAIQTFATRLNMHACMHVWFDYEVFRPRLMQLCLTASQETLPCFICMMTILTCISEASWMIYACMHEFVGLAVASHYGIHTVDVVLLKVMVFFTFTPLTSAWPGKIAI